MQVNRLMNTSLG